MNENNRLSKSERQHRKQAVDHTHASVRLSGFILNPDAEALSSRYVAGELTSEKLTAEVLVLGRARTPDADEGLLTANRIRELHKNPVSRSRQSGDSS